MPMISHDDELAGRALALFDAYADMSVAQRETALEALGQQDADLRAAILSLLNADAKPYTFASPMRWLADRSDDTRLDPRSGDGSIWREGTRLGAWCVDGVIGIGGMGVVYAAHRADGWYEQDIALKTIRPELISPALLAAFGQERRNLARLEHPAIASLVDAGISADGQPWLAMQRVVGDPIDRWCDEHRLDMRRRIELLLEACAAVRYAHEHDILHQDIKPSNLQVTQDGRIKLLDFGLSSLLSQSVVKRTARVGVSCGYAAPEVFCDAPPSVAIDVYALGVVLYRLLCGDWPSKPSSLSMPCDTDAEAPSVLASRALAQVARDRSLVDIAALARTLRGDLDAIALRAVANDQSSRYASVDDLQHDLQAWLEKQPVSARGENRIYRAATFVRRNALVFCLGTAGVCAIVSGVAVTMRERQRVQDADEAVEVLGRIFEESLGTATLSSLGTAPLSPPMLLSKTEKRLRAEAGDDKPNLLARGLATLARAQLIGGDYEQATRLAEEAKRVGTNDPLQAARTDATLAQLLNLQSRHADAEVVVREGLREVPRFSGNDDDVVKLDLRMQLARARWGQGDTHAAIAILDEAVASAEALGEEGVPALAELLGQRGYDRTQLFRLEQAESDLRRALSVLGDRSPTVENTLRRYLASVLILSDRTEEARLQASRTLQSNLRMFGPSHPETGRAWIVVGKALFYSGEHKRSVEAIDKAIAILEAQVGTDHPDLAEAAVVRSGLEFESGNLAGALDGARKAMGILERAYGRQHEATLKRRTDLAAILIMRTENDGARGHDDTYREAANLLSDAIATGVRQGLPMGYARDEYANVLLHLDQPQEAEAQALRAIADMSAQFGRDSHYVLPGYMILMKVRTRQALYDDAAAIGTRLLAQSEPENKSSYSRFLILKLLLENEIARGDPERIDNAYAEAERIAKRYDFMDMLRAISVPRFDKTSSIVSR